MSLTSILGQTLFTSIESKKSEEIKRDSWGRYRLYDPEDPKKTVKSWTRVTTFAKAVDEQSNLQKWSMRMVAKGLASDEALLIQADNADINDRVTLDRICEQAKDRAGANNAASDGTAIHTLTERIDRGEKPRIPGKWRRHIEGYKRIQRDSGLEILPEYIERVVVVPELGVAGTFDRLARVKQDMDVSLGNGKVVHLRKGEYVIGDVKSNKRLDYAQLSIAVQLAVYSRAKYMWNISQDRYETLPQINQDVGFIFHLPSDTGDAELYTIDLDRGWEFAVLCHQVRTARGSRNLVNVVRSSNAVEGNPFAAADEDTDWESRIRNASSRSELSAIWKEANAVGEWNSHLQQLGLRRLEEL